MTWVQLKVTDEGGTVPTAKPVRKATEILEYRRVSRIGTDQQYFVLEPAFESAQGTVREVVVVPGYRATYVFAAEHGDVAGFEALTFGPIGVGVDMLLRDLGYAATEPVAEAPGGLLTEAGKSPVRRTVTDVYPSPNGEPVSYLDSEIDEVDNEGNLHLGPVGADRSEEGFECAVWPAGTYIRAETRREVMRDAPPGRIDTVPPVVPIGVASHKAVSGL